MGAVRFMRRRPLIILTVFYVLVLIFLDWRGFFAVPPRFAEKTPAVVEGRVLDLPETKQNRTVFLIETIAVNGSPLKEKILVNSYEQQPALPGDILRIEGTLRQPPSSGNPGGFDYAAYLRRQGVHALLSSDSIEKIGYIPPPFLLRLAFSLNQNMIAVMRRYLTLEAAGILIPMLIGDKSALDTGTKERFTSAGVMHVLVVSGMNVAYFTAVFLWLFRLFGLRQRYAALLTLPFILLYVMATGAAPPVVRAGIMAFFVILSLALAREPLIYQSISLAALVILIFDPQALFTASFQLSFTATLGIVALYPVFAAPFASLPRWLYYTVGGTFAVSIAAQLAVLPLIALYFNRVSVIGLASNLFIVPLAGLITTVGIILYAVHFIIPFLAPPVAAAASFLVHLLLGTVRFFAAAPGAVVHIPALPVLLIPGYFLLLASIPLIKKRIKAAAALSCIGLALIAAASPGFLSRRQELAVTFLDVGEGDAIHVRLPGGRHWLIDAAGSFDGKRDTGERVICPYLWSQGVRTLDKLIITHPHLPHYGGAAAVLSHFPARELLFNAQVSDEREFVTLMETVKKMKIPWREVWAGETIFSNGVKAMILSPALLDANEDDNCLVLLLQYAGKRLLITSDMGEATERALCAAGKDLQADILQLPDHGHRSISAGFIAAVQPRCLVLSGNEEAPDRSAAYVTGKQGAVTFLLRPEGITAGTFRQGSSASSPPQRRPGKTALQACNRSP